MHVEHFMTRNPVACDVGDSVEHAAGLMRDKGVGSVVVLRGGKVAGIVTDRQLACAVLAEARPGSTAVEAVMTPDPARLTLEDNVFSALDTMRSAGIARRIPVVNDENELLGVVSISDIAVIAQDLIDGVLLEETHHAMRETRIQTGAKRIVDHIRKPTREERLLKEPELKPVTSATAPGLPGPGGGAERPAEAPEGVAAHRRSGEGEGFGGFLEGLLGRKRQE